MGKNDIVTMLPARFRSLIENSRVNLDRLREIRLRIGQPVELVGTEQTMMGTELVNRADIKEMLAYISGYSLYAFEEEISQGFLTVPGGHRIGVAGHVVMEKGGVKNIRNISFINIRLSHEVSGCAESVIPYLIQGDKVLNTLIISPPGRGKTTLIRDMVRILSGVPGDRHGRHVAVIDERSEIAGCYRGVPQNDLGCRTDVLDACLKSEGMMMAVRSLSPEIIVVDEIGGKNDVLALRYVMNCGCAIVATVHGETWEEIREKPEVGNLLSDHLFQRYILLDSEGEPGRIQKILDKEGRRLC